MSVVSILFCTRGQFCCCPVRVYSSGLDLIQGLTVDIMRNPVRWQWQTKAGKRVLCPETHWRAHKYPTYLSWKWQLEHWHEMTLEHLTLEGSKHQSSGNVQHVSGKGQVLVSSWSGSSYLLERTLQQMERPFLSLCSTTFFVLRWELTIGELTGAYGHFCCDTFFLIGWLTQNHSRHCLRNTPLMSCEMREESCFKTVSVTNNVCFRSLHTYHCVMINKDLITENFLSYRRKRA